MKRIIKGFDRFLAESHSFGRAVRENEEDWLEQSADMEDESDFSKMDLEQSAKEATLMLSDREQEFLRGFIENRGMREFQSIIRDRLESVVSEDEMSEEEYRVRSIVDKIIGYSSVATGLAIVPAAIAIGGGAALALGIYSLVSNTLRDSAWFKRGGYDKYKTGHHYRESDRSRR